MTNTRRIRTMIDASRRMRQAEERKTFTRLRQHEPEWYEGPHFIDRFDETSARWRSPLKRWFRGAIETAVVIASFVVIGVVLYGIMRAASS